MASAGRLSFKVVAEDPVPLEELRPLLVLVPEPFVVLVLPSPVELPVPLVEVVLPVPLLLSCDDSGRTCLVTVSQHLLWLDALVLGDIEELELCAAASPVLASNAAAAMSPIRVISVLPLFVDPCASQPFESQRRSGGTVQ
ncbi:MAG: hypothetical protein JO058_15930 [Alphaproteobacteria bacterium]|nr:hypothetical protein [Alphaproteobacteria bacterium]